MRERWPWLLGGAVLLAAGIGVLAYVLRAPDAPAAMHLGRMPAPGEDFSSALFQTVGKSMGPGHTLDVLDDDRVYDALEREIADAEHSIHVLQYIWEKGAASDRLIDAIGRHADTNVQCRIVIDAFGSPDFMEDVAPALLAHGCEVQVFRAQLDVARNHRKIIVVDGRVAFTGGFGVRDDWLVSTPDTPKWRDTAVRFRGPAVHDAQQGFAELWLEAGGELLPRDAFPPPDVGGHVAAAFVTSSGAPVQTRAERLMQLLVQSAGRRLWIANAYFHPSDAITELLVAAVARGVDVRVLTAGEKSDSKTSRGTRLVSYEALLDAGLRIWEYQPAMMHSKTVVVDDRIAVIGTINLEPLSLTELEENALVVDDLATNEHLARTFVEDCERSEELSP
jgi:cardiolipin synthase